MDISGDSGRLLLRLMSASTKRAEVTMHNIANQSTPGYKRQKVQFEDLLMAEMERGGDLNRIAAEVVTDEVTPSRADGNNVSMELENNTMSQNRLMYETYAAILSGRMELIRSSIEGGR